LGLLNTVQNEWALEFFSGSFLKCLATQPGTRKARFFFERNLVNLVARWFFYLKREPSVVECGKVWVFAIEKQKLKERTNPICKDEILFELCINSQRKDLNEGVFLQFLQLKTASHLVFIFFFVRIFLRKEILVKKNYV